MMPRRLVPATQTLGRELDRIDDLLVAGAAAEIAADRVADVFLRWRERMRQQSLRGDEHARRAEAALERMRLPETVLQNAQRARLRCEAFDRGDHRAIGLDREDETGTHRAPIEEDRASAAYAMLASG